MRRAARPDVTAMRESERQTHTHTSKEDCVLRAPEEAPEDKKSAAMSVVL